MKNNRLLVKQILAVTAFLFVTAFLLMFFIPDLFHWSYFVASVFFGLLTYFLLIALVKKNEQDSLAASFTAFTSAKLLAILVFVFVFMLLLPKENIKGFAVFCGYSYLLFTLYEVRFLLRLLKS